MIKISTWLLVSLLSVMAAATLAQASPDAHAGQALRPLSSLLSPADGHVDGQSMRQFAPATAGPDAAPLTRPKWVTPDARDDLTGTDTGK